MNNEGRGLTSCQFKHETRQVRVPCAIRAAHHDGLKVQSSFHATREAKNTVCRQYTAHSALVSASRCRSTTASQRTNPVGGSGIIPRAAARGMAPLILKQALSQARLKLVFRCGPSATACCNTRTYTRCCTSPRAWCCPGLGQQLGGCCSAFKPAAPLLLAQGGPPPGLPQRLHPGV